MAQKGLLIELNYPAETEQLKHCEAELSGKMLLLPLIVFSVTTAHCTSRISTPDVQAVNFSQAKERRKLNGSLIKQVDVMSEVDCRFQCVRDERCLSYNFGNTKNKSGRFVCELSDSDRFLDVGNFTEDDNFTYRGIQVTSSLFLFFIYLNSTVLVSLNQENPHTSILNIAPNKERLAI